MCLADSERIVASRILAKECVQRRLACSVGDSPNGVREKPIAPAQLRTRMFPLEDSKLLSQCQNFERGIASTAQKSSERGDKCKDWFEHGPSLLPRRQSPSLASTHNRKLLISENDGLSATPQAGGGTSGCPSLALVVG